MFFVCDDGASFLSTASGVFRRLQFGTGLWRGIYL